ncbi:MAG: calcium/sodium antiporter [Pseudomonadota bacterium]
MPELFLPIVALLVGFYGLMRSADLLVDNATELSLRLGVSTLMVGIIVIGFGTSAPEMFVSAVAALENKGNLALGNALGSNITNIGLVLGCAALISRIPVAKSTAIADLPVLVVTALLAAYFLLDGTLSGTDGGILLVILISYLYWSATNASSEESNLDIERHEERSTSSLVSLLIFSIIVLLIASRILVYGATSIAEFFGISDLIIGLTVVAIGTSLPELAAAIAAARRNVHDMILGNIIGSNVFNILAVLGITGMVRSTEVDLHVLWRDFPVMLALTLAMIAFAFFGKGFSKLAGVVFVTSYVAYVTHLVFVALH